MIEGRVGLLILAAITITIIAAIILAFKTGAIDFLASAKNIL